MQNFNNFYTNISEDDNKFMSHLSKVIEECKIEKQNKILLKISLINSDFLSLYLDNEQLAKYQVSAYNNILEELSKFNINNLYKFKDDFFIIMHNDDEALSKLTFRLFKVLQLSKMNCEKLYFNYKMASIVFPAFGESPEELLKKLECSHYDRKTCSSSYHIKYNDITNNIISTVDTEYQRANILKRAIATNQVRFAFQPIVSCKSGHINHYECLLRIVENNKLVSAGPMIPTAERLGFISIIDDLVVDMVIEELHRSNEIHFAVNISNLGVTNQYLLDKIKDALSNSKIASRLIIEITETAAQDDLDKTKKFIKSVHKLGCKVAIDDFGAGYTSFRQLKLLPIDLIKIDGWFIRDVLNNLDNRFFVETLVKMADELGTQTVAEFVENGEIAKFLLNLDVDYMQGNYFSPAVVNRSWMQNKN